MASRGAAAPAPPHSTLRTARKKLQHSRSHDDLSAEIPPSTRPTAHWPNLEPPSSNGSQHSTTNGGQPQRETLHSRFEFKQTLGKGTYGKVKLALDKRKNEQVAIKTIKKSRIENPHDLARIRREIDFMTRLNHPYIIKIKEVYESREKIILVMDYASGGELYDYLNRMKRIPEAEARAIFRQIVSAVHFLHKNQIVHRDLKLENILIDHNGDIKLADFGLSNSWSPRRLLHTFCGSPLYASPEIVSGIPYYGPEVDCWSLGVLLYTLVFGSMPFQGGDYNRLVRNITSGEFIQPREQSGALPLIQCCLKPDANTRATTKDILRHDWLAHGPVLAIRPHSGSVVGVGPSSSSPSTSLTELELHTSSFFERPTPRDPSTSKDQQQRHRLSAIPVSTRYLSSKNPPTFFRRPVSLSLDEPTSERVPSTSVPRYTLAHPTSSLAPSVFTTSSIKFAPALRRQFSPVRNADEPTSPTSDLTKSSLLDDNNNFISLRIYD